ALEFVDVFKIYRSGPAETVALRGLDVRIEPGELVAVFGPSGSGKSTMLRLACGLEQPSAGEVRAFGKSLTRLGEDELADYRARSIGIVFQTLNLWPELTAGENVELALKLAGRTGDAREALGEFGLEGAAGRLASVLSGGEQQRVAIAAAAARNAPLVLADEPTAELDATNEQRVLDALHGLRKDHGTTVVVVTHSPSVAASADRVVEIRDGKAQ
ncbi:MAG: putative transport system ATP-binding protein, partial [Gaiellaceae bacterium]|nr:putative transport system ATP-binding protein [Gaiellaceae bacterium]